MTSFDNSLEQRTPAVREAALMAALPRQIAHAQQHASAFAHILQGVDAASITTRQALAALPVTRKYELLARQQAERANDVFGGFSAVRFGAQHAPRVCQPGPHLRTGRQAVRLLARGASPACRWFSVW
jgi:phenylacetate-CoA ligase